MGEGAYIKDQEETVMLSSSKKNILIIHFFDYFSETIFLH